MLTPEQQKIAAGVMQEFIRDNAADLAQMILEEIKEGYWETTIFDAAVTVLIGHLSDKEYEAEAPQVTEEVSKLIGFRAVFQFHVGGRCEYVIVERNLKDA
jgi:hypothetical protein